MPGAGADHHAGGRRGPARLADHAGAGRQHPRGQPGAGGKRGALRPRRRDGDRLRPRICGSRRRSRSPIRGSPTRSARPPSPATSACRSPASSRCTTGRSCSTRSSPRRCWSARPIRPFEGWLDRVIGWIGNKLDELARYAADATAGGGLQSADYLMLQCAQPRDPGAQALPLVALRPSGAALRGAAAHRRRACDLHDLGAAGARIRRVQSRRPRKRLLARPARHPGLPQRPPRPARDPARAHRARAERVHLDDQGPDAVPQRDLRARSVGAPPADRNPAAICRPSSRSGRTPR